MQRLLAATMALIFALSISAVARADITIAVVGPLTGQYASFGAQFKAGAEMAQTDINAAGGVLGENLKVLLNDDACDPKQAVAVANKIVGDGAVFVAGHFCSGSSIPASNTYAEENILMISPASTSPAFTDKRAGPQVFRVCGRDDQQGGVIGTYLAKNFADKNIAVIHDKTAYGKGLADESKKALNLAGKKEVFYEAYTAGDKDYTALVTKLKQSRIDVLFVGGYHTEAGLIVRQMRLQGMKTILVGGDALMTKEFANITGKDGDGTLMTFSPDPSKNPAAAEVVKRFEDKGINPEGYVLYTYAAIQAWKQAVDKAGSVDTAKVVEVLNSSEFDTVVGKFKFNDKGDPNLPPYAFYRWTMDEKTKSLNYNQIN